MNTIFPCPEFALICFKLNDASDVSQDDSTKPCDSGEITKPDCVSQQTANTGAGSRKKKKKKKRKGKSGPTQTEDASTAVAVSVNLYMSCILVKYCQNLLFWCMFVHTFLLWYLYEQSRVLRKK